MKTQSLTILATALLTVIKKYQSGSNYSLGYEITNISELNSAAQSEYSIENCKRIDLSDQQLNIDDIDDLNRKQAIRSLQNVEYINLSNNELSTLPYGIEKLENLKHLDLSWNLFLDFPRQLRDEITMYWSALENLETINLSYNHYSMLNDVYNDEKLIEGLIEHEITLILDPDENQDENQIRDLRERGLKLILQQDN